MNTPNIPQCPLCRSYEVERMNRVFEVYFKCRKCGHLFKSIAHAIDLVMDNRLI